MAEVRAEATGRRPNPRGWLALFLSEAMAPEGGQTWPIDPIRLQKGMFLLSREGAPATKDAYQFTPYNYGPWSGEVHRDVTELESQGLVAATIEPGHTWKHYRLTPRGEQTASKLAQHASPEDLAAVRRIRAFVSTRGFRELLRDVYAKYPFYARKSLIPTP